jgi:hypothetical protein
MKDGLITLELTATKLGATRATVERLIRQGLLPAMSVEGATGRVKWVCRKAYVDQHRDALVAQIRHVGMRASKADAESKFTEGAVA